MQHQGLRLLNYEFDRLRDRLPDLEPLDRRFQACRLHRGAPRASLWVRAFENPAQLAAKRLALRVGASTPEPARGRRAEFDERVRNRAAEAVAGANAAGAVGRDPQLADGELLGAEHLLTEALVLARRDRPGPAWHGQVEVAVLVALHAPAALLEQRLDAGTALVLGKIREQGPEMVELENEDLRAEDGLVGRAVHDVHDDLRRLVRQRFESRLVRAGLAQGRRRGLGHARRASRFLARKLANRHAGVGRTRVVLAGAQEQPAHGRQREQDDSESEP